MLPLSVQAKDGISAWISTRVNPYQSSSPLQVEQACAGAGGGPEGDPQGVSTRRGLESIAAQGPGDRPWKLAAASRVKSTGGVKVYDNAAAAPFGGAEAAAAAAAAPNRGRRVSLRVSHVSSGSEEDSTRWCVGRIIIAFPVLSERPCLAS